MNNLHKYATALLLMVLINKTVNAQVYDNIFRASDAAMLQLQGNSRIEHTLKGATIIFPNGTNQLNVSINIPSDAVGNNPVADTDFIVPDYLFQLKVNIEPDEIQEELTSSKTFLTKGFLTLNSITKPVAVNYTPAASGTEENGNFNIYMTVQFNAADFNLDRPDKNKQFVIIINDAKVNRV